ncbi:MAG: HD domain-containing protein [Anaerolineae bacterium]|nr:HD domain-containing protein [Anaerolineae bacterium]
MAAVQRIRQGVRALLAFAHPVDYDLAADYLSPSLMHCFQQMRRSEQLHSLNVLRDVLAQGPTPDDLAVAALLHDVGKSRYPFPVWQKTMVVLTRAFAPGLFQRLSAGSEHRFWQRPFVVSSQHPRWSADIVRDAGASERAVWLVLHHADSLANWPEHPHCYLLKRLKAADDAN